jgi:hypothetical protein
MSNTRRIKLIIYESNRYTKSGSGKPCGCGGPSPIKKEDPVIEKKENIIVENKKEENIIVENKTKTINNKTFKFL